MNNDYADVLLVAIMILVFAPVALVLIGFLWSHKVPQTLVKLPFRILGWSILIPLALFHYLNKRAKEMIR